MITLTTPTQVSINGTSVENDTQGVCTDYDVHFRENQAVFYLHIGAGAPSNFRTGTYDSTVQLVVDLTTGKWTATGGLSGTIGAGALANFVNQAKAVRNIVESFAAGNAIMPGVQVAW